MSQIEDRPYWLFHALAEYASRGKCRRGRDAISCDNSGDCITEYCAPCAARYWLEHPTPPPQEEARLTQGHAELLKRYEDARRYCLMWGGLHPDDKSVCHQAIAHQHREPPFTRNVAMLLDDMALALKDLLSRQVDGFKLVPLKVTPAMARAYFDVIDRNLERVQTDPLFGRYSSMAQAYEAMLAASPVVGGKGEE